MRAVAIAAWQASGWECRGELTEPPPPPPPPQSRPYFAKSDAHDGAHVFGVAKARDAEGAREVTMKWSEHTHSRDSQPGPNYIAMNKQATIVGLTKSSEQKSFRAKNPIPLGTINAHTQEASHLPSDENPDFRYGRASSNRTKEEQRLTGFNPPMKDLVQGAYMQDWMLKNEERKVEFQMHAKRIEPSHTKATRGHAEGAQKAQAQAARQGGPAQASWKMKKFGNVKPKVSISKK